MWYCSLWIDFLFPSAISKWVRWSLIFLQVEVNFHWQRSREIVQKVYENLLRRLCQITSCSVSVSLAFQPRAPALIDAERFAILPKLVKRLKLFFCNEHRLHYSKALLLRGWAAATRWFTNWQPLLKWFVAEILVQVSTDKWRTFHWGTFVRLCWEDRQCGHPFSTNLALLLVILIIYGYSQHILGTEKCHEGWGLHLVIIFKFQTNSSSCTCSASASCSAPTGFGYENSKCCVWFEMRHQQEGELLWAKHGDNVSSYTKLVWAAQFQQQLAWANYPNPIYTNASLIQRLKLRQNMKSFLSI